MKRRKAKTEYNLQVINPSLAKEWHISKNGKLTPEDVTLGSHKKVWWQCAKCGRDWDASIKNRAKAKGTGCPYCANRKVYKDNCLATVKTKLASEWHPEKNGSLTPECVTYGSDRKVWWICSKGHEWPARVYDRSNGKGCPYCKSQTSVMELRIYTELISIFADAKHRKKINNIECDIYIPNLRVAIEYDGVYWHKGEHKKDLAKNIALKKNGIKLIRIREVGLEKISENDIIYNYKKGKEKQLMNTLVEKIDSLVNLFYDYKERVNWYLDRSELANNKEFINLLDILPSPLPDRSLAELDSVLASEWHPTRNGRLTPKDVSLRSNKKVWWLCKCGYEWLAMVNNRSKGRGCANCVGKIINKDNCLATVNPKLVSEWHPAKNCDLTPEKVFPQSNKKVWWCCKKGHEWQATICNRAGRGDGCPYCSSQKVCKDNCLATVNPKLASEWHPTKNNGLTPEMVMRRSGKKVWWLCSKCGKDWQATVSNRAKHGCPYCSGLRVTKETSLATKNPNIVKEWHPTKNGKLTPNDVTSKSHKKVWWKCSKGHEWESIVSNRTNGQGCPYCSGNRLKEDKSQLYLWDRP